MGIVDSFIHFSPSQMSVHQRQRSSSESESEDDQYHDQCGSIGSEKRTHNSSAERSHVGSMKQTPFSLHTR